MSEPGRAVFLSYASQDAEAARRICEALRACGIEVWFDQSELRGGDVWDQKIRLQIHDCSLFVPIISAHTDARTEGYFRLEWKLAVDRSYLMADDAAFLYPVVIDATMETGARVPERFRTVQWAKLPGGVTPAGFCRQVSEVLAGTARPAGAPGSALPIRGHRPSRGPLVIGVCALLLSAIALLTWFTVSRAPMIASTPQKATASPASVIPEHSIAVLPFVNVGAREDEEYLSDGLSEALLDLLSKVPSLQVAARTSAFSFKGRDVDVPTIGHQLMVAHVLEGSVRKFGNHLRVTARLERGDSGVQVWSEIYDRELGDVFRIQDEIAAAVVKALKVPLLGNAAPQGQSTQNFEAYLVYLQGRAKMATEKLANIKEATTDFARALKFDPNYGPAYVELASAKLKIVEFEGTSGRLAAFESATNEAKLLVERALAVDPSNAQAYIVRGYLRRFSGDPGAEKDLRRGIELNPNSARGYEGLAAVLFEDPLRRDEALAMVEQARRLDPLQPAYDVLKARFLVLGRGNLREADALLADVVARYPTFSPAAAELAFVRFAEGNYADAIMYGERSVSLDPLTEGVLMDLIRNYSDIGDTEAARQVADEARGQLPIRYLPVLISEGKWHQAAAITYASERIPYASEPEAVFVVRLDAHRTHDFRRARAVFEQRCGITWSAEGIPMVPPQTGFGYACVALGDMLISSGERDRAETLLRASLTAMDHAVHKLKRGEFWYMTDKAIALALLGDRTAALAALHTAVGGGYISTWSLIELDPAFDFLRGDVEFQNLVRMIAAKKAHERQILAQMRSDGRVPDRSGPTAPKADAAGSGSG